MMKVKNISQVLMAVIITVITVVLISCDDRDFGRQYTHSQSVLTNKENNIYRNSNGKIKLTDINNGKRLFTDEQIEEMGKIHNTAVLKMVDNIDYTNADIASEFFLKSSQIDMSTMQLEYYKEPLFIGYNDRTLKDNLSSIAYYFIHDIAEKCIDANNVYQIEDIIKEGRKYAYSSFKGCELDVVLVALTVFNESSKLWFRDLSGGIDVGGKVIKLYKANGNNNDNLSDSQRLERALKRCLIADGESAAISAIVIMNNIEVLAAAGWTGLAIALMDIGVSAAISSFWELGKIIINKEYIVLPPIVISWKDKNVVFSQNPISIVWNPQKINLVY